MPRMLKGQMFLLATTAGLGAVFSFGTSAYEVTARGLDKILIGDTRGGFETLELEARRGNSNAAFLMFGAHYRGYQFPRNAKEAERWLRRGRRHPISETDYTWGNAYLMGIGVEKDPKRAFGYFEKAANKGHAGAQYYVGDMLYKGQGVSPDRKRAFASMVKAAKSGSAYAFLSVANYLQADNNSQYLKALEVASVFGLGAAQHKLHLLYLNGTGILQDYPKAFYWALTAAEQGVRGAQNNVGYMYINGFGPRRNPRLAAYWYRRAAEQGDKVAMKNLATLYEHGNGVRPNKVLAHKWYNLAAANGNRGAATARDRVARSMTPSQINRAQNLSRRWRRNTSLKGLKLISTGTGFFVNMSHMVVTNQHVIRNCDKVAVRYNEKTWGNVEIMGARSRFDVDLAVLRVKVPDGQTFTHGIAAMAPDEEAPLGETIAVYGYPLAGRLSVSGVFSTGVLNAHAGLRGNENFIQISAPIQPGNSGSAVYDEKGRVLGVVTSVYTGGQRGNAPVPQNVNFAVKSSVLKKMIAAFHVPNYAFDERKSKSLGLKSRARLAKRNSALILCYAHQKPS